MARAEANASEPKKPLRQQAAELKQRYRAMPQRQQWLLIGVAAVVGFLLVDQYLWAQAEEWRVSGDRIEAALARSRSVQANVTSDLQRSVATFGPVEPPSKDDAGRVALGNAVNEVLKKHRVAGSSFDSRAGQRIKDSNATVFNGGLERLQAELKFESTAEELPKILADLEAHPDIETISGMRLQRNEQTRKITVQATVECWVVPGAGSRGGR